MSVTVATRGSATRPTTLTIDEGTLTGAVVNQRLRGALHPFGWAGPPSAASKAVAAGVMNVNRTDKFLTVTPIKAGGTDATHPTLGLSGSYSYDWQVVDRTVADIEAQGAGTQLYLSLNGCPQLLGGSVAPYSGTNLNGTNPLTGGLAGYSNYGPEIPDDIPAFATMCVDLIDHLLNDLEVDMPYVGVWNEPDGSAEFWLDPATGLHATKEQWFPLYAAVADAVKDEFPALKIGGPEIANPITNFTTWIRGLMVYCQANDVPLDFIAFHEYSNTGWVINQVAEKIDTAKTDLAWATPLELICGEWNYGNGPIPPFGQPTTKTELSDYGAAAVARQLIEMQRVGLARAIFFKNAFNFGAAGDFAGGLVNDSGSWAPGNAFRLWRMMADASVIAHTIEGDPGITAVAAKNVTTGRLFVYIANARFGRTGTYRVDIGLTDVEDGRETTLWIVDREHSNQFEAGLENAEPQTVPVADVSNEQVRLSLPARCACLLEIAP